MDEISSLIGVASSDTKTLYNSVVELINQEMIVPIKASDTNGNKAYPLYKKYRIIAEKDESIEEWLERIKRLHPVLRRSGYLSKNPLFFRENAGIIETLSAYFFSKTPSDFVSRKEKSYEIFGHEKLLDKSETKSLLRKLEIGKDDLRFYDTPEYCFHDYIPSRKEKMTLLICENKDIWFNIRRLMFEDGIKSLFGVELDGVVFGNGNKAAAKGGALREYVRFMGDPEVSFLYWGDIDREGFDIFRRIKDENPSLEVDLFAQGYEKMIERAKGTDLEDSPSSRLENRDFSDLLKAFSSEDMEFISEVFMNNKLIPQEIISYSNLRYSERI